MAANENFFDDLEKAVNTVIPKFFRAVLTAAGFNDQLTLASVLTNFEDTIDFLDTSDGIHEVRNALGEKLFEVEEKYLVKPSSYLKIPGNKIRLKGIQDYCAKKQQEQRDRDSREKFKREFRSGSERKKERSRSPNKIQETSESEENKMKEKLLETIKIQVHKLNVLSTQKVALANPDVVINLTGVKKNATVTCLVCGKLAKDRICTAYAKGNSWIVMNYKRHLERTHLNADIPSKSNSSLDKFIQKKPTEKTSEKGTTEDITVEVDPSIVITDDEEDALRTSTEQNFPM